MAATSAKPAPAGLSVGRIVLWGFIAVLAGAAIAEFLSKQSYEAAWSAVDAKMDEGTGERRIKESEIQQVLAGRTPQMISSFEGRGKAPESAKLAVYSWFTLNPTAPRSIFVYYDKDNEVVQASQSEYLRGAETKPVIPEGGVSNEPSPMAKAMGGGGGMSDEQRAKMAEGYQKYAPAHEQERMKKEKEAAEGQKPPEGDAASPAAEPAPVTEGAADTPESKPE